MSNMNEIQMSFFKALQQIQDEVVNVKLCSVDNNLDSLLYDVTYETIYKVMELLDGYSNNTSFDIVEKSSKEIVNYNLELHDACIDFLKSE